MPSLKYLLNNGYHLSKLFLKKKQVDFDPEKYDSIVAMKSDLGEVVQFERPVVATGSVEIWLNSLLAMVKETVKTVLASMAQNFVDPEYDFIKGFLGYCGQVNSLSICSFPDACFQFSF